MGIWDDLAEIFGQDKDSVVDNPEAVKFDWSKWKLPDNGVKAKASRAVVKKRRDIVSALILTGSSQQQIADRLGVSLGTIHQDYQFLMKEWRSHSIDNVQEHAIKNLQRLEVIIGQCFVRMIQGVEFHESAAIAGKCIQEQGTILGYRTNGVSIDVEEWVRSMALAQGIDPEEAMVVAQRIAGALK